MTVRVMDMGKEKREINKSFTRNLVCWRNIKKFSQNTLKIIKVKTLNGNSTIPSLYGIRFFMKFDYEMKNVCAMKNKQDTWSIGCFFYLNISNFTYFTQYDFLLPYSCNKIKIEVVSNKLFLMI